MTTYYGAPVGSVSTTAANCRQYFCTVAELVNDLSMHGAEQADKLVRAIRDASVYLATRIGEFIPVTEARTLAGSGKARLYLPPFLGITSIVNDDITLVATDYSLQPATRHWRNGPYTWLDVGPDAINLIVWCAEADGVVITGPCGLYDETGDTGATLAAEQAAADLTLQVSDGSKISPGMILCIGAEQELVTGCSSPTAAVTTLSAGLDASSETVALVDGTKVKVGEVIRCGFERMRVEEIQTNSIAVSRGWDGTKKAVHAISSAVDVYRTFTVDRAVNGTAAVLHTNATAIYRYLVPGDINYLCRQIAALMLKKAQAGFSGATSGGELGGLIYNNEFPKVAIEEIARNYHLP